jgi:hypothetical protein
MNHNVVGLGIEFEIILAPVRTNLGGIVDKDLVAGIFPIALVRPTRQFGGGSMCSSIGSGLWPAVYIKSSPPV